MIITIMMTMQASFSVNTSNVLQLHFLLFEPNILTLSIECSLSYPKLGNKIGSWLYILVIQEHQTPAQE